MSKQIERFNRWRKRVKPKTAYLCDKLLEKIIPMFLEAGFVRLENYGGLNNKTSYLNKCIGLQLQKGEEWPTVLMRFDWKYSRPFFIVEFSWLPKKCARFDERNHQFVVIPRTDATVGEGHAYFRLRKSSPGIFGLYWPWEYIFAYILMDWEIAKLRKLCIWLIERLKQGIPPEWKEADTFVSHKYVSRANGALKGLEKQERKMAQEQNPGQP